jgi:glycosyltransferase involved in cell wall biosynthesis
MDTTQKVLVIAYYWPPSGGSGVQRWLKFVKYLPQFGWKPYVFTPENPSYPIIDESLVRNVPPEAEIVRYPIWEPYDAFKKLSSVFDGNKKGVPSGTSMVSAKRMSAFQKVSTWIRANWFVPDPRVFWVKPSSQFLQEYLKKNHITHIITTGPPHSMHLIGYALKMKNPQLIWYADFRDPWSEWGFLDSLGVGQRARRAHKVAEQKVLKRCDRILTITPFYQRQFAALSGRDVTLLTNGYDEEDFRSLRVVRQPKFVIRHVGTINEKCDPRPFVNALTTLIRGDADFRRDVQLDFVGDVHPQFREFVMSISDTKDITSFTPPVPHRALINLYGASGLLLLVLTGYKDAEGYMPGKLFEYIATGLPILGVGPEQGDAARLLDESGAGSMIDGSEATRIVNALRGAYDNWKSDRTTTHQSMADRYSRRGITGQLAGLLTNDRH